MNMPSTFFRMIGQGNNYQKGSSLLEILITMLIMSFGLLALAGLTASSLQYSKISQFQTIGAQLAADYGDRMRGNVAGFRAENYNLTTAYSGASGAVSIPSCVVAERCTPAEMAAIDIAEWTNALRHRLPGGGAYVTHDATNVLAANIWVMWAEPNLTFGTSNLSATGTGGDQCPAASLVGLPSTVPVPRCMYFRVSL
ncbi:type IV pilus modification protein PilV [Acidovorax sp. JG5]|nr:type IV pilus modification protein PilV [Acidovorax sp. JG5]